MNKKNRPFRLEGKTALVTGASRGLGKYFAKALASAGADLAITSRNQNDLTGFRQELEQMGSKVCTASLNVCEYESIQKGIAEVVECFGRIDILVNNAGCNIRKAAAEVTWEDWNTVIDTNLRGSFFTAQAVFNQSMAKRKSGRIINIGSVTSVFGYAGITPYCASRGGVKQMTMSLADDWGDSGVTVNCLAPGWFETEQNKILYQNKAWLEYLVDRIPLKRPGKPDDLDGMVVFLASDESAYITGQTFLVDGGISTGATKATL